MSDLQLSLLVIGVLVVAGVYAYNWWQERRLRRRLQEAFGDERDDALMNAQTPDAVRIDPGQRMEPQFQAAASGDADCDTEPVTVPLVGAGVLAESAASLGDAPIRDVPWFDEELDYVAELIAPAPVTAAVVAELLSKIAAAGKPCRAAGYSEESGEWEDLARTGAGRHTRIRFALQLVTRNGPITAPQLAAFADALRSCAARTGAEANWPDTHEALQRARDLDGFCAEVDVAIGINVVASGREAFSGASIRTHAEAAGFKLEPNGVFHYRDGARHTLFTLDNHEPLPFIPEQIKTLTTTGVTLLLDVPRVPDGKRALDLMVDTAEQLANALGGRLVDDNRVALTPAGIAAIRQQLDGIASTMLARGVAPGGERALRLFS